MKEGRNFSKRSNFDRRNDKPDRRRSRGNSFKEDRRNSGESREMFDAVCSKCNKACKVPFKPTSGKPVSCSDCFKPSERRGSFSGRRDSGRSSFRPRR
jgi:CxxC-x17-CxxC domain-containing protein